MSPIEFKKLADEVKTATNFHSGMGAAEAHPSYQKIVAAGYEVLPLILEDLKKSRWYWFHALRTITGANPVPKEHAGYIDKMIQDWLTWAKENQL